MRPIDFLVEGLLCAGLYVLAGPPKSGKSWLALWLCICVARGQPLWELTTRQGEALCLCLEDNKQRLQNRLLDLLGEDDAPTAPVHFLLEMEAETELISLLTTFLAEHPKTRLVVIDTLQKVRPHGGPDYSYAADYQIIAELKRLADTHQICVLLVHHTRKAGDPDPLNTISGTTGISGAADGLLVLKPSSRIEASATLTCTGRDIESRELKLEFDKDGLIWRKVEDSLERSGDELTGIIVQMLMGVKTWSGTASELAGLLREGFDFVITPAMLSKRLRRLDGELRRAGVEFSAERSGQQRTLTFRLLDDDGNDGRITGGDFLSQPPKMSG